MEAPSATKACFDASSRGPSSPNTLPSDTTTDAETRCSPCSSVSRSDENISDETISEEIIGDETTGDPDRLLDVLLPLHDDLRIWLQHTGFWDMNRRRATLADVRRLQDLEAEKEKVLLRLRDNRAADKAVVTVADSSRGPAVLGSATRRGTRYFLIKSPSKAKIVKSQQDNTCIAKPKIGMRLKEAFDEGKSLVLFFSVNKSKAFQGYAEVISLPDLQAAPPPFKRTTPPIRIRWLNKTEMPFRRLAHLANLLNEHLPTFGAHSGQEYPPPYAQRMMRIMDQFSEAAPSAMPTPAAPPEWKSPGGAGATKPVDSSLDVERPGGVVGEEDLLIDF